MMKRLAKNFLKRITPSASDMGEEKEIIINFSGWKQSLARKFMMYKARVQRSAVLLGFCVLLALLLLGYMDLLKRMGVLEKKLLWRIDALETGLGRKLIPISSPQEFEKWTTYNAAVRSDVEQAPDGTLTSDQIEGPSYTFSRVGSEQIPFSGVYQDISVEKSMEKVSGVPLTFSVWLKAQSPSQVELRMNDSQRSYDNDNILVTATPRWERFSLTYTFPSSLQISTVRIQLGTPEGKPVLAWNASLEQRSAERESSP